MRHLFALSLIAATLAFAAITSPATAQERLISVTGQGEVLADPDMATIVIGVQSEGDNSAVALDEASAATSAILATLDNEAIEARDIRSGTIRLQPRYSQSVLSSGQQIIGYRAINSIEVDVTDLDRLGGILAAVVGDGANRLDRVTFGLQDPTAMMDEARRRAVAEGARLAQLYADAANVPLGDLQTLSEGGGAGYRALQGEPVIMAEMAVSSPQFDVPVAPGQITLTSSVSMVFMIAP